MRKSLKTQWNDVQHFMHKQTSESKKTDTWLSTNLTHPQWLWGHMDRKLHDFNHKG